MDRFFSDPPYHYPIWGCQPSSLTGEHERAVYTLVEQAALALGIVMGPIKADVVWTDDGPVILEMAPRFHGDVLTAYTTPLATGGSPIKAWLACLAGKTDPLNYLGESNTKLAGWMGLFPTNAGELLLVEGVENAQANEAIEGVHISIKAGSTIKAAKDNTALCGFVWATGQDSSELFETLSTARHAIRFVT